MTRSGYRHFFVLGSDLKDAEENFMKIDEIKRNGFNLDELPIRLEYEIEKCKEWSMDNYWSRAGKSGQLGRIFCFYIFGNR